MTPRRYESALRVRIRRTKSEWRKKHNFPGDSFVLWCEKMNFYSAEENICIRSRTRFEFSKLRDVYISNGEATNLWFLPFSDSDSERNRRRLSRSYFILYTSMFINAMIYVLWHRRNGRVLIKNFCRRSKTTSRRAASFLGKLLPLPSDNFFSSEICSIIGPKRKSGSRIWFI